MVDLLLRQRLAARRVGRAWLLRPSPAAPLWQLLRADGVVSQLLALVGLRPIKTAGSPPSATTGRY